MPCPDRCSGIISPPGAGAPAPSLPPPPLLHRCACYSVTSGCLEVPEWALLWARIVLTRRLFFHPPSP